MMKANNKKKCKKMHHRILNIEVTSLIFNDNFF